LFKQVKVDLATLDTQPLLQLTTRCHPWNKLSHKKHKTHNVHFESGHDKDKARILANQDLVGRHGEKAGFTAEELCDILS